MTKTTFIKTLIFDAAILLMMLHILFDSLRKGSSIWPLVAIIFIIITCVDAVNTIRKYRHEN